MEWEEYLTLYGMSGQEARRRFGEKSGRKLAQAGERSRAGRKLVDLKPNP